MFGKTRSLAALPWTAEAKCEDARAFFERMAEVDRAVSQARHEVLQRVADGIMSRGVRKRGFQKPEFAVGERVWLRRPKGVVGPKLEPEWQGPYLVWARNGRDSYTLKIPNAKPMDAHVSQLKKCHWGVALEPVLQMQVPPGVGSA